jgi:hypothetical protein
LEGVDSEIRAEHRGDDPIPGAGEEGDAEWQRPIDQLRRRGTAPLPPAELTDETLGAKLWELLHHLACRGFYLLHTDHLSDRELYTSLWEQGLRAGALLPRDRSRAGGWFHDVLGSGSEEQHQLWLRFYATTEERAKEARERPEHPLPPRERPPHNRDWRLPKGPF